MAAEAAAAAAVERHGGKITVMFVCLGNICRSPMAEAVFKHAVAQRGLADRFVIDSSGTANYHIGSQPDHRTIDTCRKHNVPIHHRCQQLHRSHFDKFHFILGMDESNISNIKRVEPQGHTSHVGLFGSFDKGGSKIIEDPYYDGMEAFESVYEQCLRASEGLLRHIQDDLRLI